MAASVDWDIWWEAAKGDLVIAGVTLVVVCVVALALWLPGRVTRNLFKRSYKK